MERAQAAEDRIASLEADVLAAQRGVSTLPTPNGSSDVAEPPAAVPPAPAPAARYDDMWSTPYEEPTRPGSEPQDDRQDLASEAIAELSQAAGLAAAPERNGNGAAEATADRQPEPPEEHPEDGPPPADDMWSLRARLADAAARKKHGLEHESR
jgi:hypothetical protein